MIVKYKLLGQPVYPVNSREISLEISHDQESIINQPKPHVGINNLYFAREDIQTIMNYIATSPGCLTEGLPFDIEIKERGVTETINMYLNLMEGFKRSNDGIEASVKMLQSLDWLDDRIDGFTLESMYNETGVASFTIDGIAYSSYQDFFDKRCIYIPYVISTIPNFRDAFMATFSLIYIGVELYRAAKQLFQWVAPIGGVGIVLGVAQLILELAFTVLLILSIIVLIRQLIDCLIQPIKYHGAMLLIDMLKIVSQKLGLNFVSSIWNVYPYNQIAYLPEKFNPIEDANPNMNTILGITFAGFAKRGFTSPGYSTGGVHDSSSTTIQKGYMSGTGGDIFRLVKNICNGKIIIPDQTNDLVLERRDYYPAGTPYQLPDIRQDWNGYNTDELTANILVRFADDLNDKNCIDKYIGTIFQATHSQIMTIDQRLVMLKGIREIQINAARGIVKGNLNFIEKAVGYIEIVFHAIVDLVIIVVIYPLITALTIIVAALNVMIAIFNALIAIISVIVSVINAIVSIVGGSGAGSFNSSGWNIPYLTAPSFPPLQPLTSSIFTDRVGSLLLENDMVSTPKLLLVDTTNANGASSNRFTDTATSPSGQARIAYLIPQTPFSNGSPKAEYNAFINAGNLWNNFYAIDCFVDNPPNAITGVPLPIKSNRFTKISPSLNKDSEKNPFILSLADFKNLVSNPKLKDNFAEEIIADTIQWRIGDESGRAEIEFRKAGWLKNPQSNNGATRAQEININLQIKTSLPNGQ